MKNTEYTPCPIRKDPTAKTAITHVMHEQQAKKPVVYRLAWKNPKQA